MPKEWSDEQYEEEGKRDLLEPGKSYEGRSNRSDQSDWRDFHLAVQRAAAAAAADLEPGGEDLQRLPHEDSRGVSGADIALRISAGVRQRNAARSRLLVQARS